MKKIISFEKELDFPSMIGEITSISLDQQIEFNNSSSATGKFIISGTYKMTEASTLVENFNYEIPVEIELTERLDLSSVKTSINDFNYEIINDDVLKCNIDLLLEGVEEIVLDDEIPLETLTEKIKDTKDFLDKDLTRECDGDLKNDSDKVIEEKNEIIEEAVTVKNNDKNLTEEILENEISMPEAEIDENLNIIEKKESDDMEDNKTNNISSLFQVFENSEETFTTYSVYIIRKEDSIEKILDTYNVTKEELSEYNDLNNLEIGSKIIIPNCNE